MAWSKTTSVVVLVAGGGARGVGYTQPGLHPDQNRPGLGLEIKCAGAEWFSVG